MSRDGSESTTTERNAEEACSGELNNWKVSSRSKQSKRARFLRQSSVVKTLAVMYGWFRRVLQRNSDRNRTETRHAVAIAAVNGARLAGQRPKRRRVWLRRARLWREQFPAIKISTCAVTIIQLPCTTEPKKCSDHCMEPITFLRQWPSRSALKNVKPRN